MPAKERRIYWSTFINAFGNWLTFLAIALVIKDKAGPEQVALAFLVQTLPAILFSRSLANMVRPIERQRIYRSAQLFLSINSFYLCFTQEIWALYLHLFLGATCKALSGPLFNVLVADWLPKEAHQRAFTRIGAIQASTIALAPAFGAWLKVEYPIATLFFLDGLSFLVALALLPKFASSAFMDSGPNAVSKASPEARPWHSIFQSISPKPENIPRPVILPLRAWFLFLAAGALLNAIEFPVFAAISLSEREIGWILAAWGLGNLAAFFIRTQQHEFHLALLFALGLFGFVTATNALAMIASFAFSGANYSLLSGALRARLQGSIPSDYDALPIWAYANQITQIINLVAFGASGTLLKHLGLESFAGGLIVLSLLLVFNDAFGRLSIPRKVVFPKL